MTQCWPQRRRSGPVLVNSGPLDVADCDTDGEDRCPRTGSISVIAILILQVGRMRGGVCVGGMKDMGAGRGAGGGGGGVALGVWRKLPLAPLE